MNNLQKAFKNKAKCGLRMATGGVVPGGFLSTIPDALPTSMFAQQTSASANPNQGPALYGSTGSRAPQPAPAGLAAARNPQQRESSPLQKLDGQIAMGNAVENSNLTMAEKGRLGFGTTSAEASDLRSQTSALSTLRDSLAQQQPVGMADGGIVARLAGRGAQIDNIVDNASNGGQVPAAEPVDPDAPDERGVRPSERAAARAEWTKKQKPGMFAGLRSKLGFAEGGMVHDPEGTGRHNVDTVDAKLAEGEAVLPHKTVLALGGPAAVEHLIETTNGKPTATRSLRGQMHAADGYTDRAVQGVKGGATPETATHWPNGQPKIAPTGESMQPAPTAQEMYFTPPAQQGMRGAGGVIGGGASTPTNVIPLDGTPKPAPAEPAYMAPLRQKELARAAAIAAQATRPTVASATVPIAAALQTPAPAPQQREDDAGKLVDFAQRSAGLRGGNDAMANSRQMLGALTNDAGVRNSLNASHEVRGDGINYGLRKTADGRQQVEISGGMPTKSQYLDVEGKPTNDWNKTPQYAAAIARNDNDKRTLRDMEHARIKRTAAMPGATEGDRLAYAGQLKQDEIDGANSAKAASAQMAGLEYQRGLRNDARNQANVEDAAATSEEKDHQKNVDDYLKSYATVDGKLDDQKYAFMQKYASQFARPKGMKANDHLRGIMDNWAVDNLGETEGRHWASSENPWAGEKTKWQKRATSGIKSTLHGSPLQNTEYYDPLTKRTIYQSDVDKLSPNQKALFESRITQ